MHSTCTSYVLYTYLYCVYALVKEMTPLLLNEAFSEKSTIIKFFSVAVNPYFGTYMRVVAVRRDRHTHVTTTVTLAAHVREG